MSIKILFWYDPRSYSLMDTWVSLFGLNPIVIDPDERLDPVELPESFSTLEAAKAAYPGHTWVWLCCNGSVVLDEFEHPEGDDVIYVFGHNVDGCGPEFDDEVGPKVRLRDPAKHWDYLVAPQVLYDRQLYQLGRRR